MEKTYNSKQIAEILGVSVKSVRRYLNSYFSVNNGAYEVSEKMLETLKTEHLGQAADTAVQQFDRVEYLIITVKAMVDLKGINAPSAYFIGALKNQLKSKGLYHGK